MDRKKFIEDEDQLRFYEAILGVHKTLDDAFLKNLDRSLPLADTLLDRWDRAKKLGFGKGTSIYDSSVVLGKVNVGANCWIGPFSLLDGSGGLELGDFCTVAAGVQIYTHDNVKQTLSSGKFPIERTPVQIGSNVYIAPNAVIVKGIKIGNFTVIGANSLVNKDIPSHSIAIGQPAKVVGKIEFGIEGEIVFNYF